MIVQLHRLFVCSTNHHTIPFTSYWGTIIVTILSPGCVLTSAARCPRQVRRLYRIRTLVTCPHRNTSCPHKWRRVQLGQTRDNTCNLTPTNLSIILSFTSFGESKRFYHTSHNLYKLHSFPHLSPPSCHVTVSRYIIGKSRAYATLF